MNAVGKETALATRRIGRTLVEVVLGNVADQSGIDAVVNPTTGSMQIGGGVGGAIAAKVDSKALSAACSALAPLAKTSAVVTPGFGLQSPNIIHCRGPRHSEDNASDALGVTYWNIFSLAESNSFSSLVVPAVSAGAMGFPIEESARIAVESVKGFSPDFLNLKRIRFVLFGEEAAKAYAEELMRPPPIPAKRIWLDIGTAYSSEEFDAMRQGLFGDHDTKWYFFFEEPWLCIYRGNRQYGRCHFWLRLPDAGDPTRVEEAWADAEVPSLEAPWGKEKAEDLIRYLLDDRFGLLRLSGEKESVGGAWFWVKRGKVALDCSPGQSEGLLSADQAAEIGRRLIGLAESLGYEQVREDGKSV